MDFIYETKRLSFRLAEPALAPLALDFYLRDRVLFEKYEGEHLPAFFTEEFQRENLARELDLACKNLHARFYVFLKGEPDRIIGTVCFHNITLGMFSSCEIGYKFSSSVHHKGYATEAVEKCIDLVFSDLKLHRIVAWISADNAPSLRLAQNLGFVYEGTCRERVFLHGKWTDQEQYSLLLHSK